MAGQCRSDNRWISNQTIQKVDDVFHQLCIFFFDLDVALIADPLLCAFASCVLQSTHRLAAGWADNRDFQQVDPRLPIRARLCVAGCLSASQVFNRCFVDDLWISGISKVAVIIHDPHNPGFVPCDNTGANSTLSDSSPLAICRSERPSRYSEQIL